MNFRAAVQCAPVKADDKFPRERRAEYGVSFQNFSYCERQFEYPRAEEYSGSSSTSQLCGPLYNIAPDETPLRMHTYPNKDEMFKDCSLITLCST